MTAFQPAKTIWIVRHYNDVVNSMLRSFNNMAKQVQRIAKNPGSGGWLGEGISNETHNVIKSLTTSDLDDSSASALQWYFRNRLFFDQSIDCDERVLLVGYEKLVTSPTEEFERIFRFAGIDYTPRVSRKVSPRSIGKNPAPKIATPIREVCDDLLNRFRTLL